MPDIIAIPTATVGGHLNEETINSFVPSPEVSASAAIEIDLKDVAFATPYAIILLSLIIKSRRKCNAPVRVILPASKDVLNYLERMSFFDTVEIIGVTYDEDPNALKSNKRNPSSNVIEITRIEKEEDVSKIVNDLAEKLIQSHGCDRQAIDKFSEIMIETFQNATQHSNPQTGIADAIAAVQVYKSEFHFVIADSGIGIKASLKSNPRFSSLELTDAQAIAEVLKHGYSRIDVPGRGGGLERVQEIAQKMSGEILIRSNSGLVRISGQSTTTEDVNSVTGTQICIKCPTSLFS